MRDVSLTANYRPLDPEQDGAGGHLAGEAPTSYTVRCGGMLAQVRTWDEAVVYLRRWAEA